MKNTEKGSDEKSNNGGEQTIGKKRARPKKTVRPPKQMELFKVVLISPKNVIVRDSESNTNMTIPFVEAKHGNLKVNDEISK